MLAILPLIQGWKTFIPIRAHRGCTPVVKIIQHTHTHRQQKGEGRFNLTTSKQSQSSQYFCLCYKQPEFFIQWEPGHCLTSSWSPLPALLLANSLWGARMASVWRLLPASVLTWLPGSWNVSFWSLMELHWVLILGFCLWLMVLGLDPLIVTLTRTFFQVTRTYYSTQKGC